MRVLFPRFKHGSVLGRFLDIYMLTRLKNRSRSNLVLRGQPVAIFADDWVGLNVAIHGVYEKDLLESLFGFLEPLAPAFHAGLAIDIGANIGNHCVYFSRLFGRVYAFEPNPLVYRLLDLNASLTPNVACFPFGLGDEDGTFELCGDGANFGASSLIRFGSGAKQNASVDVRRLDSCDLDLDGLSFVKIDVEGFEARVVLGARQTLNKYQPIVVLEQDLREFQSGSNSTETLDLLKDMGYVFCWTRPDGSSRSWVVRRARNLYDVIFGETVDLSVVTDDLVPPGSYSLLIAVSPKYRLALAV